MIGKNTISIEIKDPQTHHTGQKKIKLFFYLNFTAGYFFRLKDLLNDLISLKNGSKN